MWPIRYLNINSEVIPSQSEQQTGKSHILNSPCFATMPALRLMLRWTPGYSYAPAICLFLTGWLKRCNCRYVLILGAFPAIVIMLIREYSDPPGVQPLSVISQPDCTLPHCLWGQRSSTDCSIDTRFSVKWSIIVQRKKKIRSWDEQNWLREGYCYAF